METINKSRLFTASCFALLTTSFAFAIRAGIMGDLQSSFGIDEVGLGWINFMGIFGFPIATLIGGPLYNSIGPKSLGWIAFFSHIAGISFSILSGSFWPLFFSTFFISFGNGMVEAAFNPMIADMYEDSKAKMLNKFHVWFPGGIAIGAIAAYLIGQAGGSWQMKIAFMYIPALIYGALFFGQQFPKVGKNIESDTKTNLKAMFTSPIYLVMIVCMALTATTELGTQNWVEKLFAQSSGVNGLWVLALITTIMALGRFFAGPLIHKLDITGVLFGSAIISTIAIVLMSQASGSMIYIAAVMFAVGVCYFWPNMISFVAEYLPKTGALGMSVIGGVGMVGLSIFQPIIGGWLKTERAAATARGLSEEAAELAAGQATLDNIAILPAILIVAFGIIFFTRNKIKEANRI
jgi:MFS family permease